MNLKIQRVIKTKKKNPIEVITVKTGRLHSGMIFLLITFLLKKNNQQPIQEICFLSRFQMFLDSDKLNM